MNKIFYDTKKYLLIPESVEELDGKQLIGIAEILHNPSLSMLKASLMVMRVLSKKSFFKFFFISSEVKMNCLEYVQWVFEKISTTKNLLPHYKKYYGPSDELNNMTLAEFHFAERYYAEIKGDDYGSLPHLIATIYRAAKPGYNKDLDTDGDVRQTFNSNTINYYAKKISKWPKGVQYAILIFYDSCREKIADDNPEIFGGGDGEDDGLGMYAVMRGLAGPKFGDLEKVETMLLHNALTELNLISEEEKELEKKYKS